MAEESSGELTSRGHLLAFQLGVDLRDVVLRALHAVVLELLRQRQAGDRLVDVLPSFTACCTAARNAALNSPNSTNAAHVVGVGVCRG